MAATKVPFNLCLDLSFLLILLFKLGITTHIPNVTTFSFSSIPMKYANKKDSIDLHKASFKKPGNIIIN